MGPTPISSIRSKKNQVRTDILADTRLYIMWFSKTCERKDVLEALFYTLAIQFIVSSYINVLKQETSLGI